MGKTGFRKPLLAALVAAALVLAGLGAAWLWAAGQVAAALEGWSAAQRARGYTVAYSGPDLGGYPLAVTAQLDEPAIAAPQGWRWSGERITGRAAIWSPLTLDLELPRAQALSFAARGQERRVAIESGRGLGAVAFRPDGEIESGEIEILELSATGETGWRLTAERVHAALSDRRGNPGGVAKRHYFLNGEASDITLPEASKAPFGPTLRRLALQAAVFGRVPAGPPAEGLAAWRDGGGRIEVEGFILRYGPLDLLAKGEVRLDGALRPQGVLEARIGGLGEALDRLSEAGLIDRNAAFALKLSALALSRPEDGTGRPVVELPITLRDGLAYLGPVALFRLAPVI